MKHCRQSILAAIALVIFAPALATAASRFDSLYDYPGNGPSISSIIQLPDFSRVYISDVSVCKISRQHGYWAVTDPSDGSSLVILTPPSPDLMPRMVLDVSGDIITMRSGRRALASASAFVYLTEESNIYDGPPIMRTMLSAAWPWKRTLTPGRTVSTQSFGALDDIPEPGGDPNPDTPAAIFCEDINAARDNFDPDSRVMVELDCDALSDPSFSTFNLVQTDSSGQPTDSIPVYYSGAGNLASDDRVNIITAAVQADSAGEYWLEVDQAGPNYGGEDSVTGSVQNVRVISTIPHARTLPYDGSTAVTLPGVIVMANQADFPNALYVQESDSGGNYVGMRVAYNGAYVPARGCMVDVSGTTALASDGEVVLNAYPDSAGGLVVRNDTPPVVKPLGMFFNKSLGGSRYNVNTPGVTGGTGPYAKSVLVKTWGTVTAVDTTNKFLYIDDGCGLTDSTGAGASGVRVSWDLPANKPAIVPPPIGVFLAVTGESGSATPDNGQTYYRVLRPRDQNDLCLISPQDSGPPNIAITSPPDGQLHKATGQSTIRLWGTASDDTCVTSVQVAILPGLSQSQPTSGWYPATYTASSQTWYYDWTNVPDSGGNYTIWAIATDFARKTTAISRNVTAYKVHVYYVDSSGSGTQDGSSWANAMNSAAFATYQAARNSFPVNADSSGNDVWVAAGTYLPDVNYGAVGLYEPVQIYGGFAGNETSREQRNWALNKTVLDGNHAGAVVNVIGGQAADTFIDGFTIQNSATNAGGIYLYQAGVTISHNVIQSNSGSGIYTYQNGSPSTIASNWIIGNDAGHLGYTRGYGRGICGATVGTSILNNTFAGNTASLGGGAAYLSGSSSVTLANNIVVNNGSGIYIAGSANFASRNNDIWGNVTNGTGYLQAPDTAGNISADPVFVDSASGDYRISANSSCTDAGWNSVSLPDSQDICAGPRRIGPIDIGAYEVPAAWRYRLFLTGPSGCTQMGDSATATALALDVVGNCPAVNMQVNISVDAGTILSVNTIPIGAQTATGTTDSTGNMTIVVSDSTGGTVNVTATPVWAQPVTKSVSVCFYDFAGPGWPMFHHDVALCGVTSAPISSSLSKKWVAQLNGNSSNGTEHTWPSPVVANGVVYACTNGSSSSQPNLYAFGPNGTQLAATYVGAPVHGTPCVDNGLVYVGAEYGPDSSGEPGRLHVYTLQGGQFVEQWYYDCCGTNHTLDSNQKIWGSISVFDGAVYFGSTYATYPTSDWGWFHTVDLSTHQDRAGSPVKMRYSAIGNTPGIDANYASGPRAYLSDYSCYVTAVSCQTGAAAWPWPGWNADPASMYASPVAYQGYVFVGSNYNCVYRLTDSGGGATYSTDSAGGYVDSTPAAYNGKIYYGCNNNDIYCVDATSLQQSSALSLGSAVISSPAISSASGLVFVASNNAVVYALDANNVSNQLWYYNIRGDYPSAVVKSSPAVAGGQMFIIAGDSSYRYLYCFGN